MNQESGIKNQENRKKRHFIHDPSFMIRDSGLILINVLVFAGIAITVTIGLVNWGATVLKNIRTLEAREQAFQIAEAGIEYYRWHLAHAPTDYYDGTGNQPGPYIHDYENAAGEVIGRYELTITPPPVGSTLVGIASKGILTSNPAITRTIKITVAIPSFAQFAVVGNDDMYFSQGTEVYGPVHSNTGIRFDGVAHNLISSARYQYNDPENPGEFVFGVYTTIAPEDPPPPAAVPTRPDIFTAGRLFPVPGVDFDSMTYNLAQLKSLAQNGGHYYAASNGQAYHMVLKTNDTYDLYKVTSLNKAPSGCTNGENEGGWGTQSIKNEQFIANYPFPSNGVVFAEDHLWVDGKIDGARITIAVGRFPEAPGQYRNMILSDDLLYTNYDGTDVIGLIAQGDINIGLDSPNAMRIDAALVAQNGRAGRYYYETGCGPGYERDVLTLYGMIASNGRFGFAYTDGTGYTLRNIIYDNHLLFAPPPSFPLISNQYQLMSWQEL